MHNTDVAQDTWPEISVNYRFCVRTLILRSVTATKTGQAPAESHVKRIKLLRKDTASYGLSNGHVSLRVLSRTGNGSHILYY